MQGMTTSDKNDADRAPYLEEELVGDLRNRLSRIEGHIRGIKKMLHESRDCDDVLTQVAGVKAALNQAALKLLEGHLETCVRDAVGGGEAEVAMSRFKSSLSRVLK